MWTLLQTPALDGVTPASEAAWTPTGFSRFRVLGVAAADGWRCWRAGQPASSSWAARLPKTEREKGGTETAGPAPPQTHPAGGMVRVRVSGGHPFPETLGV